MNKLPAQFAEANKASVEAMLTVANTVFASAERLAALNLNTARTLLEDSVANTKALLSAIPSIDIHQPPKHILLKGEVVSPINPKPGCRFAARCRYACERCHEPQVLREYAPNHFVACHNL